jgi:hypothetical protein
MERLLATAQVSEAGLEAQGAVLAVLPDTSDHELPPSVDLYSPTPASESLEPFGSPVPTYTVFPVASVGSKIMEPMAFESMPLLEGVQLGVDASALLVFHTPPPAAPIKTVQLAWLQVGDTAIAVARPLKKVAEVPAVDSLTTVLDAGTPLGPMFCQLAALAPPSAFSRPAALAAPFRCGSAMKMLGYAVLS